MVRATDFFWIGVGWHVLVALMLLSLALGWRPIRKVARLFIAMPVFSASVAAWVGGNVTDGTILGLTSLALLTSAIRRPAALTEIHWNWHASLGLASIAFAWFYPTFLVDAPAWHYAIGAPMGVLPAPSLAVAIGLTLVTTGHQTRTWSTGLASIAVFYGAFGAFQLGLHMDAALLIGAFGLILASAPALLVLPEEHRPF